MKSAALKLREPHTLYMRKMRGIVSGADPGFLYRGLIYVKIVHFKTAIYLSHWF